MKTQLITYNNNQTFTGKIPKIKKTEIKKFTVDYLMKQDGYVSSKGSIYNGVACVSRIGGGGIGTGVALAALPEVLQNPSLLTASAETATLTGSIGAVFVGLNRLENDIAATAQAKIKARPFVEKLKEAGFAKKDEVVYGIKQFMNKKGGFFTSIVPNKLSSKKAEKIFEQSTISNK